MRLPNLNKLFQAQLQDLYSAESQILRTMPRLAKRVASDQLREAMESHAQETRGQLERLKRISESLGVKITGRKCKAMQGLIEEGKEAMESRGDEAVLDAALIAAAQRVEHYEISAYGTAVAIAEALGHKDAVRTLKKIELQEGNTDKKLTAICESELLN